MNFQTVINSTVDCFYDLFTDMLSSIIVVGIAQLIVTVCGLWLLQTLSVCLSLSLCTCVCVCLSVCLSVCPTFTAYISLTMGRILVKLDENVGPIDCIKIS